MIRMIIIVGLAIYAFTIYEKLEKANEQAKEETANRSSGCLANS